MHFLTGDINSMKQIFVTIFIYALSASVPPISAYSQQQLDELSKYATDHSDYSKEKIPERILHATGYGAYGYFEVTNDITHLSEDCVFLSKPGRQIPIVARFSMGSGGRNVPDSSHDNRGLAIRFMSECGIWDVVSSTFDIFFFKDPQIVPSFILAEQQKDAKKIWELRASNPESTFHTIMANSFLGAPENSRHTNMAAVHTFRLIAANGTKTYAKFHFISEQGAKYNNITRSKELSKNPDHAREDLLNAIANGDYPSWKLMIQTMSFEQAKKVPFDVLDSTFSWPRDEFPLQPVGRIVLNRNPQNYTAELEVVAFNPGYLSPGIEASNDPVLQYRIHSYPIVQRHRLGSDYKLLSRLHKNFSPRDQGPANADDVVRDDLKDVKNFAQAAKWYQSRPTEEQQQILQLTADALRGIPSELRDKVLANYDRVDNQLGKAVRETGRWL